MKLFWLILARGCRGRCPQCAGSPLFSRWFALHSQCTQCGLDLRKDESDLWSILYFTTAFLTGVVLIGMLIFRPASDWRGRLLVASLAMTLWLGTYRWRKGLAVAVLYFVDWRWNNHGRFTLRGPGAS